MTGRNELGGLRVRLGVLLAAVAVLGVVVLVPPASASTWEAPGETAAGGVTDSYAWSGPYPCGTNWLAVDLQVYLKPGAYLVGRWESSSNYNGTPIYMSRSADQPGIWVRLNSQMTIAAFAGGPLLSPSGGRAAFHIWSATDPWHQELQSFDTKDVRVYGDVDESAAWCSSNPTVTPPPAGNPAPSQRVTPPPVSGTPPPAPSTTALPSPSSSAVASPSSDPAMICVTLLSGGVPVEVCTPIGEQPSPSPSPTPTPTPSTCGATAAAGNLIGNGVVSTGLCYRTGEMLHVTFSVATVSHQHSDPTVTLGSAPTMAGCWGGVGFNFVQLGAGQTYTDVCTFVPTGGAGKVWHVGGSYEVEPAVGTPINIYEAWSTTVTGTWSMWWGPLDGSAPTPTPTASPSASPAASPSGGVGSSPIPSPGEPGGGGTGNNGTPPPAPPQGGIGQPRTGVPANPGGPGGLGSPFAGMAQCEPSYPKAGQVVYLETPDVPFPGLSIDVPAWLNWIGSILNTIPDAIGNVIIWMWNGTIDLVLPSDCFTKGIEAFLTQLRETPPLSYFGDMAETISGALGGGGSAGRMGAMAVEGSPELEIAGQSITIPVFDWFAILDPYRDLIQAIFILPLCWSMYGRWRNLLKPKQMGLGL